jgi:hypothetical protein
MGLDPVPEDSIPHQQRGKNAQTESVGAGRHQNVAGQAGIDHARVQQDAQPGRAGDHHQENDAEIARADVADEERDREIELFFDGERPGDAHAARSEHTTESHPEVLREGGVGPPGKREGSRVGGAGHGKFSKQVRKQREANDQEVQRQDAVGATKVEGLEIAWGGADVEQDAADEESGEHKEKVDAAPGELAAGDHEVG